MSTYVLDPAHSTASFSIKHMMIAKVHGGFEKLSGKLTFDPKQISKSSVDVTIDAASINTREPKRDAHLKSPDFFNVEEFPNLIFKSKRVVQDGAILSVVGDLTIRGVTKEIALTVDGPTDEIKDPYGNIKIGASGTAKIKRKDFGLTWNAALETGGVLVGDDVTITIDVQFVKQV